MKPINMKLVKDSTINDLQSKINDLQNYVRPFGQKELSGIHWESLDLVKADIKKWREAIYEWDDDFSPDRVPMYELYNEVWRDDRITTHFNTILNKLNAEHWVVKNDRDDVDEDATKLLKKQWFEKLIRYYLESEMVGHSLITFPEFDGSTYDKNYIRLIPRHYVIPERRELKDNYLMDRGKPYDKIDYLVDVGSVDGKGLFNDIYPLFVYKKNALGYWSNYQRKFGIPPVIAKTDLENETKVKNISNFLKNMVNNVFGLIGRDDEIEALNGISVDAYNTYNELIKYCDSAIARRMEGQTMTSEDGSSRSQAEVHERTADSFHYSRVRGFTNFFNEAILPRMENDGAVSAGSYLSYNVDKDVSGLIDNVVKLYQAGKQTDDEWLEEQTGIKLREMPQPGTQPEPEGSIMPVMENYYKGL